MPEPILNAKQYPQIFYCRHMLPGVVWYEGNKARGIEAEMVWIDTDAMKRSIPTMATKPVFVHHQSVPLNNIEEQADGYIIDCFYNELDGWLWAKMLVTSDEAQKAVQNKWSVSNAYIPLDWDEGGQHLNVDYHRKIRNYEFTHLAIVPNPRYEEAKIFTPEEFKAYQATKRSELEELQNSKPIKPETGTMFFRSKKEEVKAGDTILDTDFTEIKNSDGTTETVTVGELKKAKEEANRLAKENAAKAEKENAKKNEKVIDDEDEVEVDGEKVNMADLKKCYTNMKGAKKNADDEAAAKEEKAKEEKANSDKEAADKKAAEEKENAKRFEEMQNAHTKSAPVKVETQMAKEKRGQSRYGSSN